VFNRQIRHESVEAATIHIQNCNINVAFNFSAGGANPFASDQVGTVWF